MVLAIAVVLTASFWVLTQQIPYASSKIVTAVVASMEPIARCYLPYRGNLAEYLLYQQTLVLPLPHPHALFVFWIAFLVWGLDWLQVESKKV